MRDINQELREQGSLGRLMAFFSPEKYLFENVGDFLKNIDRVAFTPRKPFTRAGRYAGTSLVGFNGNYSVDHESCLLVCEVSTPLGPLVMGSRAERYTFSDLTGNLVINVPQDLESHLSQKGFPSRVYDPVMVYSEDRDLELVEFREGPNGGSGPFDDGGWDWIFRKPVPSG